MPRSATSHLHRRSSCRHYPHGRLRYADRLRRPRWRNGQLSTNIPPGPLSGVRPRPDTELHMLFNSLEFFGFLAVVYLTYRILPFRWQNRMLLVAGYVFYGWWDVRFLFLIAFSTTVDFSIGVLLAEKQMPARLRRTASL